MIIVLILAFFLLDFFVYALVCGGERTEEEDQEQERWCAEWNRAHRKEKNH